LARPSPKSGAATGGQEANLPRDNHAGSRRIRAVNLLGTRFVSRLLLALLIAHDALVGTLRRLGLRLWHALLAAAFAALILYTFQIVLSRHRDQILFCN
jgi:hypothetical protein